jgi:hypothetical protein
MLIPIILNYITYSLTIWQQDQLDGLNECVTIELDDYIDKTVTPSVFAAFYCMTDDDPVNITVHYIPSYKAYRKSKNMPIESGLIDFV